MNELCTLRLSSNVTVRNVLQQFTFVTVFAHLHVVMSCTCVSLVFFMLSCLGDSGLACMYWYRCNLFLVQNIGQRQRASTFREFFCDPALEARFCCKS